MIDPHDENRLVYGVAFFAAIGMLVIIPVQIAVFMVVPMPTSVAGWFDLFNDNPLVGLFHADLFILVNNVLIAVIYLALYHLLKETSKGLLQIGMILGFIGIAAYLSSNKSFELLGLAHQYARAGSEAETAMLLAAGKAMLAGWQGTAFDAYYVLNGITLLIIAGTMFQSRHFTKLTAAFGLAAAIFMTVPSTAGMVGLVFSLLSLIPWYGFTILIATRFFDYGLRRRHQPAEQAAAGS